MAYFPFADFSDFKEIYAPTVPHKTSDIVYPPSLVHTANLLVGRRLYWVLVTVVDATYAVSFWPSRASTSGRPRQDGQFWPLVEGPIARGPLVYNWV